MVVRPGVRLRSGVCRTEVIVVKAPDSSVELACGGVPLLPVDAGAQSGAELDPALAGGTLLGKRYGDPTIGIEVLCTKAGQGSLTCNGAPLPSKDAKPLPASD